MLSANNKHVTNLVASFAVVSLLLSLSIGIDGLLKSWPDSATRPGKGIVYLFLYFVLLWCFLIFYGSHISQWMVKKQLFIGAIIGFFVSIASVIITSYIAFVNPIERLMNSIEQHGLAWVIGITLTGACWKAIILGGWLFGLVSVPLLKMFQEQVESLLNPNSSMT